MSLAHLLSASLFEQAPPAPRVEPLDHWHFKSYRRLPAACPIGFRFADFERERDGGAGRMTTYAFVARGCYGMPKFVEVGWDGIVPLDAPDVWSARLETIAAAAWESSETIASARKIIVASASNPH